MPATGTSARPKRERERERERVSNNFLRCERNARVLSFLKRAQPGRLGDLGRRRGLRRPTTPAPQNVSEPRERAKESNKFKKKKKRERDDDDDDDAPSRGDRHRARSPHEPLPGCVSVKKIKTRKKAGIFFLFFRFLAFRVFFFWCFALLSPSP